MAAAASLSAVFSVTPSRDSLAAASTTNWGSDCLKYRGLRSKRPVSSASRIMLVKASANGAPVINERAFGRKTDSSKTEDDVLNLDSSTFSDELPDYNTILAGITTLFLEAEKQKALIDRMPKKVERISSSPDCGMLVHDGTVFRQSFPIRSYEVGADQTSSIETVLNHLQETSLNHARVAGVLSEGFGVTPEMRKRGLLWVVTKMKVLVEKYPTWGDAVDIDSWISSAGKNGMSRDWDIRDGRTGRTITRATSTWAMMDKHTRRLSKMPEEVKAEITPFFSKRDSIVEQDDKNLPKIDDETAGHVREGLSPRWTDLDCNQHVNNVKYMRWVLESVPASIMESYEMVSLTLEFRRECRPDGVVRSLTVVDGGDSGGVECCHLLRLEGGPELVRGRTEWRPKLNSNRSNSDGSA